MTRQFANAVSTTLSSSMTSVQTTMAVTSATGFPSSYPFDAHIEAEGSNTDEIVSVTSLSSGTTYNVTRASEDYGGSSSASAHASGANVRLVGPTAGALAEFATLAIPVYALGTLGATAAPDWANGPSQSATLSANVTITPAFTGLGASDSTILELWLYEDGTGGWTPTLSSVTWPGGTTPPWDLTAGALNHVLLTTPDGATTVYGIFIGPGLRWLGAWSSATAYVVGDAVSESGSSYICIAASTNNVPPNASYWDVLAQSGTSPSLGSAMPLTDGTGAAGTSSYASHEDHVHPMVGVDLLIADGSADFLTSEDSTAFLSVG